MIEARLGAPTTVRSYPGDQRHQSWRIRTASGDYWLKIERGGTSFASLANETQCLIDLAGAEAVPSLAFSGTAKGIDFLVTHHRDGLSLDRIPDLSSHHVNAVLERLVALQAMTSQSLPAHDVEQASPYSPRAHPIAGFAAVRAGLPEPGQRLDELTELVTALCLEQPEPVRVHGSSDPTNILVAADGSVTFLDWEASREGPAGIDRASIVQGLLALNRPDLAEIALAGSAETAGFLSLRLLYLQSNGRLSNGMLCGTLDLLRAMA